MPVVALLRSVVRAGSYIAMTASQVRILGLTRIISEVKTRSCSEEATHIYSCIKVCMSARYWRSISAQTGRGNLPGQDATFSPSSFIKVSGILMTGQRSRSNRSGSEFFPRLVPRTRTQE
jgi:hypothetical protein